MGKVSKALWVIRILMDQIDLRLLLRMRYRLRTRMALTAGLQELSVVLLTSVAAGYGAGLSSWCLITRKKLVWRLLE